jgi:hypothetical protein
MDVQNTTPYYKWSEKKGVRTVELYNKFINWVMGEFDLYLILESNILEVYFPNGKFSIKNYCTNNYEMEIKITGKSTMACEKVKSQLNCIYNHLINLKK